MPLSIVGSNGGSFRKLNLQISQTIESLQMICHSLNRSKQHWWLSPATLQSIHEMKSLRMKECQEDLPEVQEYNDDDDFAVRRQMRNGEEENDDDDGEMIDLQANEEEQSFLLIDDDNDEQDTDGNISEDESV